MLITEGFLSTDIDKTGVKERSQRNIKKKVWEGDFPPEIDPRILKHDVADGERCGRPKEISKDVEEGLIANVRSDRASRSKSSKILA
jgi:hypothetical protein